jgi:hypothetical protein
MYDKTLTPEQVVQFQQDGVLVIRGFYDDADIRQIQHGIYDVIGQVMIRHGVQDQRGPFSPDTFDNGFLDLIKRDRAWGGEVYDAIKQIPAFVRLTAHPAHEAIFKQLRHGAIPGIAAGGCGIRIDNPHEDRFRAMWHQEYPAQLRSLDGIVYWTSLVRLTEALGPVVFCPGSHREGALPVCNADPDKAGRIGAYALKLHQEEAVLAKYEKAAPLTSPGDLVIIDFLVLHASGYNRGDRPRWSVQTRYFNFADATGRSHAWQGSYAAGVNFRSIHPDLYVDGEQDVDAM